MPEPGDRKIAGMPETSESEEMYLLTIRRAAEAGHDGPVGVAHLAERLSVSPASANEMVRKLESRGLVGYEPYKGASLTPVGAEIAGRVLRTRRLWARFLADHLGFTPHQADELACDLEHATSIETVERLAEFLGHPAAGPLGEPIPAGTANTSLPQAESLSQVPAGTRVEVVAVAAGSKAAGFFSASGLQPGSEITVAATGEDGVLVVGSKGEVHLDAATCASVLVQVAPPES